MKNPKNNFGFGAIGVVIVLLVLAVVGLAGYIVWDGAGADDGLSTTSQQTSSVQTSTTPTDSLPTKDPNEGYFVVKEWGLRFKVPPSIFDVRYKMGDTLEGDTLAFYAKPTGLKYDYVKDYDQVSDSGFFSLANGVIYRSKESTKDKIGIVVEGKKIGDYYYYTAWSFSGLATGAACLPLYEISDQELQCEEVNKAFWIVNDDFIKSIELAK